MNPQALNIAVTDADGTTTRWGPDEPGAQDIPDDLTFSTSIPGGFKDLSCSLLRRVDVDYADQALFNRVHVYGRGNRTAWQGRLVQFPRSHGDSYSITPGAVGMASRLRDDPTFTETYADRAITNWNEPSLVRRLNAANSGLDMSAFSTANAFGGLAWTVPVGVVVDEADTEVAYDAGPGVTIAALGYKGTRAPGTFTSFESATLYGAADESLGASPTSTALTLDDTVRVATITARRYMMLRLYLPSGPITTTVPQVQSYSMLTAYGSHGLTRRTISGETPGFYLSDLVGDVVSRIAPELSLAIDDNLFVVPHAVYQSVTGEDAVMDLNKYALWDWGVYDDDEFFYRAPDPDRLTWQTRLDQGARIDFEGDTAEQMFNGVVVDFDDGTGQRFTVGPTGAPVDYTDSALLNTDPNNPCNRWGITRYTKLQLSSPSNLLGATTLGVAFLAEKSLPQRRGNLVVYPGTVNHPDLGATVPTWMIRAGDYIQIADHPANVPRRIIETTYNHRDGSVSCQLDNTSAKLDAILERIGVAQIGFF